MKKQNCKPIQFVRFRRWSRANYAVFRSIACCVTIGKVCKSICEMSFRKSNGINTDISTLILFKNEAVEDSAEPDELFIKNNETEQVLFTSVPDFKTATAALLSVINYFLLNIAVGIRASYANLFFYKLL